VLAQEGFRFIEVNLEPIPHSSDTWERTASVIIRKHGTAREDRDIETNSAPEDLLDRMQANLEPEDIEFLLFGDILPLIDWELYETHCNGGCPLDKCRKN